MRALYILLYLCYTCTTYGVNIIQASTLSCGAPTMLTASTIIELDVDIIITNMCSLIIPGGGFGPTDTVTFQATASNNITIASSTALNAIGILVVTNPGIWDVRAFSATQTCIFNDIIINMDPGAVILADGATFALHGSSQIITNPITP